MEDLYDVLGVDRSATTNDIKSAYRKLVMEHHPDKGGDPEMFSQISRAYDTLSDESARAEYDSTGRVKGDQPDNDRAIALGLIDAVLETVFSDENTVHLDIIAILRDTLRAETAEVDRALLKIRKRSDYCDRLLKRLTGEGPVRGMLEHRKTALSAQISSCEDRRRQLALALEILEREGFDPEPRPEPEVPGEILIRNTKNHPFFHWTGD